LANVQKMHVAHAKNARGISPPSLLNCFTKHYLVAMAMSLDKSTMLNQPNGHVLYNMSNSF